MKDNPITLLQNRQTNISIFLPLLLLLAGVFAIQGQVYAQGSSIHNGMQLAGVDIPGQAEILLGHNDQALQYAAPTNIVIPESDYWHPTCERICEAVPYFYTSGYCFSPTLPTYCVCSIDNITAGVVLDGWTECLPIAERSSGGDATSSTKLLINFPSSVFSSPYDGESDCSIRSGTHPLVLNAKSAIRSQPKDKSRDAVSEKAPTARQTKASVEICKVNCKSPTQWTIQVIEKDKILKGYYIRQAGKGGQYLYRNADNTLSFIADPSTLADAEKSAAVWHVGAAEVDKAGNISGYRILSGGSDFTQGLAVDKKTGAVAIYNIYDKASAQGPKGEDAIKYTLNPAYDAIWNIATLKPPVKTNKATGSGSKN
ncbi:MAG: hypothetical protein EP344_16595 [Bacteroidetes bacterium]|nr:MAG: hypothetical protein EP344_16595 [Bacteroidota bacterium]